MRGLQTRANGGDKSETEETKFENSMKNIIRQKGHFNKNNPNHKKQ